MGPLKGNAIMNQPSTTTGTEGAQPQPMQIALRIAYNGVIKTLDHVAVNAQVQSVLARALELFNVTDRPHAQGLFRENGTEVSPSQSVTDAKLFNEELLVLRARTPQGG